jgi:hypothetical protein
MTGSRTLAGVGSIAFGVLMFVALLVAAPPGGTYSANDATDYVAEGHRAAVIISLYLLMLAVVGLVLALAYLRQFVSAGGWNLGSVFWGAGVAAAASFAVAWCVIISVPLAIAFGGSAVTIAPEGVYTFSEVGWAILIGAGAFLLGISLVALMLGSKGMLPGWVRWATLVAGLGGIAGLAFFPFFLVLIWGLVAGIWLLATGRTSAAAAA